MISSVGAPDKQDGKASVAFPLDAIFAHAVCIVCLVMQRFGPTIGGSSQLAISLAVVPVLCFILLLSGQARINLVALTVFVFTTLSMLVTTFLTVLYPDFSFRFSLLSFVELGLLYGTLLFQPTASFRSEVVLPIFCFWCRVLAIASLLQYGLQFAHVYAFSFRQLHIPSSVLLELNYNVVAPISYGSSIFRSNGFFLLEPSILSQTIALGCIVEGFVLKWYRFLPIYGLAILSSFSGTGLVVLAGTAVAAGLLSPRQIPRVLVVAMLCIVVALSVWLIFPTQFAALTARASGNDPSAQARYFEQINVFQTISHDARLLLGFGPGAADGFVKLGSLSSVLKIVFDYGVLGGTLFLGYLIYVWGRARSLILGVAALITFQFGGGYTLFPPMVFILTLICVWSRAQHTHPGAVMSARAPWARSSLRPATQPGT